MSFIFEKNGFLLSFNASTSCPPLNFHGDIHSKKSGYPTHIGQNTVTFLASATEEVRKINHCRTTPGRRQSKTL